MAAASFTLFRPLVPTGALSGATSCSLLGPASRDLVVVRNDYLEVYSLSEADAAQACATEAVAASSAAASIGERALLQRRYDQQLYGNIEGISAVRLAGWTRDALLLASPHSKLSLCAWDLGSGELVTLAIWSQDEDVVNAAAVAQAKAAAMEADQQQAQQMAQQAQMALTPSPLMHLAKHFMAPLLRVDPLGRCAALVTYDNFLNIFDLTQPLPHSHSHMQQGCQTGVSTSSTGTHSFHSAAPSALSSLAGVGVLPALSAPKTYSLASLNVGSVTDIQFLHGLEDPTLLILHEKQRTWAGRYAATALGSQEVTVLTFDRRKQAFSTIGGSSGVSHDTTAIYPIPMPVGGALLFSMNAVWHWSTHNQFDYALSLNALLGPETLLSSAKSARIEPAPFVLTLDQAYGCFLLACPDRVTMFLSSKHGEAYLLQVFPGGGGVKNMQLQPVGHVPVPQGCVRLVGPGGASSVSFDAPYSSPAVQSALAGAGGNGGAQFVFAYSRMGPSLLLEYRKPLEDERREQEQEAREEEAEERKANAEAEARAAVKMEPGAAGAASGSIPSLGAQLEAAATAALPGLGPLSNSNDDPDQPAAKRSRIDDLYQEAFELGGDELMDVFGFAAAPSSNSGAQGQSGGGGGFASSGAAGEKTEEAPFASSVLVASSNSTITAPTSADGTLLDAAELEQKEAEAGALRVAAAKEDQRRTALDRAIRTGRHDLRLFVRDSLVASAAAPGQDLALGTVLPPEEDARLELEEREAAAAGEDKAAATTSSLPKNAPDDEVRAAEAAEIQELQELQKRWRAKERRGRVLELVQLSGHEDSGALVLSQEGVVPDVIATLPLEQRVTGCWTLRAAAAAPSKGPKADAFLPHEFIVVSTAESTLVFRAGEQIQQLLEPEAAVDAAYDEFLQSQPTSGTLPPWSEAKKTPEAQQGTGVYAALTPALRAQLEASARDAHKHSFDTRRRTVFAARVTLASGASVIVQVTSSAVRIISNSGEVTSVEAPAGSEIASAHLSGDRVVGRLRSEGTTSEDESSRLFHVDLSVAAPTVTPSRLVTASATFADSTRLRALKQHGAHRADYTADGMEVDGVSAGKTSMVLPSSRAMAMDEIDDDLERVFGGGSSNAPAVVAPVVSTATTAELPPEHYVVQAVDGAVEIRTAAAAAGEGELVCRIPRFAIGQHALQHVASGNGSDAVADGDDDALSVSLSDSALPRVVDLFLGVVSDAADALPVLMAFLENGDFLAYHSFIAVVQAQHGAPVRTELRWRRVAAPAVARPFLSHTESMLLHRSSSSEPATMDADKVYSDVYGLPRNSRSWQSTTRFHAFSHLACTDAAGARRGGLLIAGTKPLFVSAERGSLRFHPFVVDWRARSSEDGEQHSAAAGAGLSTRLEAEEDVEGEGDAAAAGIKKEGLACAAPFDYAERNEAGNRTTARGLLFFDTQGNLHISKLQPALQVPSHPLYLPARKRVQRGLSSPLVTALSSHSSLSACIAPSPALLDYDSASLLRRTVHLGVTPLFVARHVPTSTTAVVVSRRVRVPSKELELERSPPVYGQRYEVLLFHSRSWELIGRHADFEPQEMILTCCAVAMHKQVYIALGTSVYHGEDVPARGRIVLIDLYHALAPAPEGSESDEQVALLKIKVYSQAEKLPVSVLCPLAPNLLVAAEGSRIILYSHNGSQLVGRAFIDCDLWVTSLSTLHSFILYGDVSKGLHLLYYDGALQTLVQLGASLEKFHVTATEFLVDGKQLSLAAADQQGNLHLLKFTPNTTTHYSNSGARGAKWQSPENTHVLHRPQSAQSMAANPYSATGVLGGLGYQLTLKNDFHVGEKVGHMIKLRMRGRPQTGTGVAAGGSAAAGAGGGTGVARSVQSLLLMSTYGGGLAHLLPVEQALFRRLSSLAALLSSACPWLGGLHPLGYRLFKARGAFGPGSSSSSLGQHPTLAKKVLDLSLLLRFLDLDADTQWRLSRIVGTTPAQMVDALKRISWATQMH